MAERKSGHGGENRQRQHVTGVRLSPVEHGLLKAEAARTGRSEPKVLREAFLASLVAVTAETGCVPDGLNDCYYEIPDEDMVFASDPAPGGGLDTWDF